MLIASMRVQFVNYFKADIMEKKCWTSSEDLIGKYIDNLE